MPNILKRDGCFLRVLRCWRHLRRRSYPCNLLLVGCQDFDTDILVGRVSSMLLGTVMLESYTVGLILALLDKVTLMYEIWVMTSCFPRSPSIPRMARS